MKRVYEDQQKEPEPHFLVSDTIAKQTRGKISVQVIELFIKTMKSLKKEVRDPLLVLLFEDSGASVEFTYGNSAERMAPAETFLLATIDNEDCYLEDLSDLYLSVSFPWNKVNRDTAFKVFIRLGTKWLEKAGNPAGQLGDLIHEYALHGIPCAQFIHFVRETQNVPGEIALYYFYYAGSTEQYLNAVYQHRSHGTKQPKLMGSSAMSWKEYSGNGDYNKLISLFRGKTDEKALLTAAVTDVNNQSRDPSAGVDIPPVPKKVTATSIRKVKIKGRTIYSLLQEIAICSYDNSNGISGSIVVTIKKYPHFSKDNWVNLLSSCCSFFEMNFGDVFGLNKERIGSVVELALQSEGEGEAYSLVCPQPRDVHEACIIYIAYGGYQNNLSTCNKLVDLVFADYKEVHWNTIAFYKTYRFWLGKLLEDEVEAEVWKHVDTLLAKWHTFS